MKVRVDQESCTGCGLCLDLCPDMFELNDEALAEAKQEDVPENLEDDVREAADECPVEAIVIEE